MMKPDEGIPGADGVGLNPVHKTGIQNFADMPTRRINWPDQYSWTDHCELTNTLYCYLIAADRACPACTATNPQHSAETQIATGQEAMLILGGDRMPRIDPNKVIRAHEILRDHFGYNFITDMGGENLTLGYENVVRNFAADPILDGLVYTSSMYFLSKDGERPNKIFDTYEQAGLFSGAMYLNASVDRLVQTREQIPDGGDVTYPKAFAGLKLMDWLNTHGYNDQRSLGIHMTIRDSNVGDVLPLYEWAGEHNVWFSFCDVVYEPYRFNDNEIFAQYLKSMITAENQVKLAESLQKIYETESERLRTGKDRTVVPSSAFLRMSQDYGVANRLSCRVHRGGQLPNTADHHPSGQKRACIAQNTVEDVQACGGCAYISIDRGNSDYVPFEVSLFQANQGDAVWRNAYVNRKHPEFRQDRKNLSLKVGDGGEIVPLHDNVVYFDRYRDVEGRIVVDDGRMSLTKEPYYGNPLASNIFSGSAIPISIR